MLRVTNYSEEERANTLLTEMAEWCLETQTTSFGELLSYAAKYRDDWYTLLSCRQDLGQNIDCLE